MFTYFPIAVNKNLTESPNTFWVNGMWTKSTNDFLSMAWRRPCGAISITTALFGMCVHVSSNRTGLSRLLVWYSAEQYRAKSVFHFDSGTEVLSHRDDLGFGFGKIWKSDKNRFNENPKTVAFKTHFRQIFEQSRSRRLYVPAVERNIRNVDHLCENFFRFELLDELLHTRGGSRYCAALLRVVTRHIYIRW